GRRRHAAKALPTDPAKTKTCQCRSPIGAPCARTESRDKSSKDLRQAQLCGLESSDDIRGPQATEGALRALTDLPEARRGHANPRIGRSPPPALSRSRRRARPA